MLVVRGDAAGSWQRHDVRCHMSHTGGVLKCRRFCSQKSSQRERERVRVCVGGGSWLRRAPSVGNRNRKARSIHGRGDGGRGGGGAGGGGGLASGSGLRGSGDLGRSRLAVGAAGAPLRLAKRPSKSPNLDLNLKSSCSAALSTECD
jgi:hypothetical protein